MNTGKFQFQLSNNQCDIHLIYQPSFQGTSQRTASNVAVEGIEERWTGERIGDFVRKLGFLHKEKNGCDEIKQFLHLNSVSILNL